MRSVFLKIFLWFWLTVLAVGLTFALTTLVRSRDSQVDKASNGGALLAEIAAERFEQHRTASLKRFLESVPVGNVEPYTYLFDAHGTEVRGRLAPPEARHIAAAVNADRPYTTTDANDNRLSAWWTAGPSGRSYELVLEIPPMPMRLILSRLGIGDIIGVIAVSLVAGLLCFQLARHITKPLVKLGEIASRLADGHLETRVDAEIRCRRDEIGGLGESFDRMAERLASLVDAQRRLLSVVSHELRSPLTRLSLALGVLRQRTEPGMTEFLDRAELEAEHLEELIGQLLTLAKIDAGADLDRAERFDLGTVVQEVAADGDFEAQQRGCSVTANSPATLMMQGVAANVRRAIENPVRNAIRHTQPNTSVEISIQRRGVAPASVALIQIRDHGPGVPPDRLEKIFLPFHKVEGVAAMGGAGLGLAITERIVRSHGGNVWATNASDGGLIVAMELPLID
jgi:two-component system, OmpR family, sensor histidine kinase CpxA